MTKESIEILKRTQIIKCDSVNDLINKIEIYIFFKNAIRLNKIIKKQYNEIMTRKKYFENLS